MGVERGEREPLKTDGEGDSLLQDKLKSKASMACLQPKKKKKKKREKKKKKKKKSFFSSFQSKGTRVLCNSRSPPVALVLGRDSYKNHGPK
jgi:hypothetical protein